MNQIVSGVPKLQIDHKVVCKACALGKYFKKPFRNSDNRCKEVLDLIHFDVCGPMPVRSLGGLLYYVTFIDDFFHMTQIYLMKTKDDVFTKLQEFKAEVENLIVKKIKILRSDNGREYTSKELAAFCKKDGIKELIVLYYSK